MHKLQKVKQVQAKEWTYWNKVAKVAGSQPDLSQYKKKKKKLKASLQIP